MIKILQNCVLFLRLKWWTNQSQFRICPDWRAVMPWENLWRDWIITIHMMTSSNGNIFRVTGHLCGEVIGHRWIPHTKASDADLWCFFFYLCLNKWLSKQSWGWWCETLSRSLWRHRNEIRTYLYSRFNYELINLLWCGCLDWVPGVLDYDYLLWGCLVTWNDSNIDIFIYVYMQHETVFSQKLNVR